MSEPATAPAAAMERPFLRWLLGRFFRAIAFPAAGAATIRRAADGATLVYVCRTLSYIDYLYFSYAFLRHGLPLSRFANGVSTLFWRPLGRSLRRLWSRSRPARAAEEELVERARSGEATTLFLKRPQTLLGREPAQFRGRYVEALIDLQRQSARPIRFVPLVLLWGSPLRAARSRHGLVDRIFGEREAPGRLRALWTFFTGYRDAQVLVGEPLELPTVLAAAPGLSDEGLARRLRWMLAGRLESEVRVVLGPPRKSARRLKTEVLRSRRLVAEAQAIGHEEQIPPVQLAKRARAELKKIAADPKPWLFAWARPLLSWIFRKIFDGIEIDRVGLERLREAARRGPLVIVPSHKSHIDYLVLSYLFLENDLLPPHVAAGANLSFWPLGFFFRRGGAFFLRRSFKGDRLYGAVFRAYVRKLLRERFNLEFFIEGGRSRTGKLLRPKLGLLGMVVEAALDDDGAHARQAQVVPVSIGYEKVIEEKAYAKELAGGQKRKEDVKGLIRATRVLGGRYGRLNVQFAPPLPLGPTLQRYGALVAWDEAQDLVVPAQETAWRQATLRLAHRIVYDIDRVTALTPTALLAAALLGSGRRGLTRRELLAQVEFLLSRARRRGARLAAALAGGRAEEALDRALELLARDGDIEVRRGVGGAERPLDEIYVLPEARRPRLAYYRNNALHLFAEEGLVALALGGGWPLPALRARTLRLSRLLKLELTYRVGEAFHSLFERTLAELDEAGLVRQKGDAIEAVPGQAERLALLAGQVVDLVESYLVAARGLGQLRESPLSEKELVRRIHDLGERLYLTGQVRRREACLQTNYANAVVHFKERAFLVERDRKLRLADGVEVERVAAEIAELLPAAG